MRFKINNFYYNDKKGIIEKADEAFQLTKIQKKLLDFFIAHPKEVLSKQVLMDKVWKRVINDNSVNKTISKLRSIIEIDAKNPTIIVTTFGHGISFEADVAFESVQPQTKNKTGYYVFALLACVVIAFFALKQDAPQAPNDSLFLFVSDSSNQEDWLQQSSLTFIDEVFGFMGNVDVRDINQKPKFLDNQQYIANQFELSPNLKVIRTNLSQTNNLYSLNLSVFDKQQNKQTQTFTNENLGAAMKQASSWLASVVDKESSFNEVNTLIPSDSYVVETYIRGLSSISEGDFEKAEYSFKLCLKEIPEFHLARLKLAKVKMLQGKMNKSLAILDTLSKTKTYASIGINVESIRGDIYDTQGKHEQARDLFLNVLKENPQAKTSQLNSIRFNLSHAYTNLTEYNKALEQLSIIESSISVSIDANLLASVYQKQGSIFQRLGQTQEAQKVTEQALILYSKLEDLLGEAKTYSTLARITTHQSEYNKSVKYLEKALAITRTIDYKIGIGATLNDLIYLLMVQGEFNKAWLATQEMKKIAIDIDYSAMIQIAKQYEVDITRAQKKWIKAEMYLQEHLQLAQTSKNKRALLKNKMLALELYLDQYKLNNIQEIIDDVQSHIDETQELRLQPRINKLLGRFHLLSGQYEKGLELLVQSKNLALETQDGETIIEINNLIAQYYVDSNQAQKALRLLEESSEFKPLPYPFLLIKSKANEKLGNLLIALDLANECKITANEFWQSADTFYLNELQNKIA